MTSYHVRSDAAIDPVRVAPLQRAPAFRTSGRCQRHPAAEPAGPRKTLKELYTTLRFTGPHNEVSILRLDGWTSTPHGSRSGARATSRGSSPSLPHSSRSSRTTPLRSGPRWRPRPPSSPIPARIVATPTKVDQVRMCNAGCELADTWRGTRPTRKLVAVSTRLSVRLLFPLRRIQKTRSGALVAPPGRARQILR